MPSSSASKRVWASPAASRFALQLHKTNTIKFQESIYGSRLPDFCSSTLAKAHHHLHCPHTTLISLPCSKTKFATRYSLILPCDGSHHVKPTFPYISNAEINHCCGRGSTFYRVRSRWTSLLRPYCAYEIRGSG